MSFIVNLKIVRGTTFGPYQIVCKDAAGVAVPLAGYSAEAQARKNNDSELAIDLSPEIEADDALGIITIPKIDNETTAALAEDLLKWDLILITPTGERIPPFVFGEITVETPISLQS